MANFGNFCLLLSLCLAVYALFASLAGAAWKQHRVVRSAERAAIATCATITLAIVAAAINDNSVVAFCQSPSNLFDGGL